MKKLASVLICFLLLFCSSSVVSADMGPKPSVMVTFSGIEEQEYYISLLSKEAGVTGPYIVSGDAMTDNDYINYLIGDDVETGKIAWQAFRNYVDGDGFYFVDYFGKKNQQNTFTWGYYPPEVFKILVYFPNTDQFAVSDICEQYAFKSYFSATIENSNINTSQQNSIPIKTEQKYEYTWEIISLILRILATIGVELIIALLFGLRQKKILLFILILNIITQVILNVLLNAYHYNYGYISFILNYLWMELVIIFIEGIAYTIFFRKVNTLLNRWTAPVYAVTANILSFVIGLWLAALIPGIF